MTVEKRVRLGIGDIAAITFKCSGCGAALTLKAIREFRLGPACPACHQLWPDGTDDPRFRLFRQIADVQALSEPTRGYELFLEINMLDDRHGAGASSML